MKITKLVHSCLLVESNNKRYMVDPGDFSWGSGLVKDEHLTGLDYVVVTHAHGDHLDPEFCKNILANSPDALWFGPEEVRVALGGLGISCSNTSNIPEVRFIESEHANGDPWFTQQPDHTSYVIDNELLVSGDHQAFTEMYGARILAGAFTAPWGSIVAGARKIKNMTERPEIYIPVHDWHLNDTARDGAHKKAVEVYGEFGVKVLIPVNGQEFEV
jgi:L-ascorbate metabolism protein UlaG (beta-lactamase superfamily)